MARTGRALAALCALIAALGPALPPAAAGTPDAAVVTAAAYLYAPGDAETPDVPLRMTEGSTLTFVNLDPLGYHTITAQAEDEHGEPLFESGVIGMGESAAVGGADALEPGSYAFYCEAHNPAMQGTLEVVARDGAMRR